MELILERIAMKKSYTIGRLSIAGKDGIEPDTYFCDTLEPKRRDYKNGERRVEGCSAIPEGRYAVVISFSEKSQKWLPVLLGGPEFNHKWKDIRIHSGSTVMDTDGGILVGLNLKPGQLLNSAIWLYRLKRKIVEAKEKGEGVWIQIQNY